jgi:hypothetical protein
MRPICRVLAALGGCQEKIMYLIFSFTATYTYAGAGK